MPAVPLPFLVAMLLAIVVARMARHSDGSADGRAFLALTGACAVQAGIVGLRWGYDLPLARLVQPILASALPWLAWRAFGRLRQPPRIGAAWVSPHAVPVLVVAMLAWLWRPPIDGILTALFIGYGLALLRLARGGADRLSAVRFGAESGAHRALAAVGALLVGSGLVDLAVAAAMGVGQGGHAAAIVAAATIVNLVVAGYAAAVADRSRPAPDAAPDAAAVPAVADAAIPAGPISVEDRRTAEAVMTLLRDRKLYRDPDLTLSRLARRAGLPVRTLSAAVNRVHGRSISQIVNACRVDEAQRLLTETDAPVTTIMFEAGFQTKSNFNRAFREVTGMNPSAFRRGGATLPHGDALTS